VGSCTSSRARFFIYLFVPRFFVYIFLLVVERAVVRGSILDKIRRKKKTSSAAWAGEREPWATYAVTFARAAGYGERLHEFARASALFSSWFRQHM